MFTYDPVYQWEFPKRRPPGAPGRKSAHAHVLIPSSSIVLARCGAVGSIAIDMVGKMLYNTSNIDFEI